MPLQGCPLNAVTRLCLSICIARTASLSLEPMTDPQAGQRFVRAMFPLAHASVLRVLFIDACRARSRRMVVHTSSGMPFRTGTGGASRAPPCRRFRRSWEHHSVRQMATGRVDVGRRWLNRAGHAGAADELVGIERRACVAKRHPHPRTAVGALPGVSGAFVHCYCSSGSLWMGRRFDPSGAAVMVSTSPHPRQVTV